MKAFCIYIVTENAALAARWVDLLKKSGANVRHLTSVEDLPMIAPVCGRCLALMDIEDRGKCGSQGVKEFCSSNPGISVILFGKLDKVSNIDVACYLEAGADDFIPEDIDERVLLAKLGAHVRRSHSTLKSAPSLLFSAKKDIKVDRVSVEVAVKAAGGNWEKLSGFTAKEFDLLCAFLFNRDRVLCRSYLLDIVWGESAENVNSEVVDKHVESIRRKLGKHGRKIRTVYGAGYVLKED